MKLTKRKTAIYAGVAVVILVAFILWNFLFSATKVGFLNYQVINLGEIARANDNSFISVHEVQPDELGNLDGYDMVFINGMGLRITETQRELIQKAAENGLPVLTTAATNPANNIGSLDEIAADSLRAYLQNGGRRNYRSMLNYVRKHIDGKLFSCNTPEAVVLASSDLLYHPDVQHPDNEPAGFNSISAYDAYLRKHKLWKKDAPRIIVTGQMGEPASLISRLEHTGNVVYGVRSVRKLIKEQLIDSINPSAIINMAHGRMGDEVVNYLNKQNIPLFAPLNVNRLVTEWEADRMGMNGGFMSQSIVTPEIDGAIRPYVLFGHFLKEDGLQYVDAIPGRLELFVNTVNNHIALSRKQQAEKKIAVFYYKGPGQNSLTASGMEVAPSLYNLLVRLKNEGYKVENLPADYKSLEKMIQAQGAVFNLYAEGAFTDFMKTGNPELISEETYSGWVNKALRPEVYAEVVAANGEFPGNYMTTADGKLGIARLQFGNVVLLPQVAAATGSNSFQIVHGAKVAPPHTYVASYLWTQFGFKADALIHFGTHGSLEFTPGKQVALCSNDWPELLVGSLPHFYIYSIGNVGEGIIAKRRSYAGLQSYLTPPFKESKVRAIYSNLNEALKNYNNLLAEEGKEDVLNRASLKVKKLTIELGIHRELELDSIQGVPYSAEEVSRIESFAEELANEKMTGKLYTMGETYDEDDIESSVYAMSVEPIAYSLLALDKQRGKAGADIEKHRSLFTARYICPAKELVGRILSNPDLPSDELVCRIAQIKEEELKEAREIAASRNKPVDMMSMMMNAAEDQSDGAMSPAKAHGMRKMDGMSKKLMKNVAKSMPVESALSMAEKLGADSASLAKMKKAMMGSKTEEKKHSQSSMMKTMMAAMMKKKEYGKAQLSKAIAISEIERTIHNVGRYRKALMESPEREMASLMNALQGGYVSPSSGGDPIANPSALPTGRNLYAVNAETTPSEAAWEKGIRLANHTIEMYKKRHNDSIPRKVSYTLWSSEFIETEGATVAQVLYMLGVEPVRDAFGRVTDLRLIPSKELGRSRIDVVVQTSGQLRDLAASRLALINRAVEMAAAAKDDWYENQVNAGVVESERILTEKGLSPKEARKMAAYRVFGGINGNYGTGITGMVEAGDRWEKESEIAATYLHNMGAYYGSEKEWESFRQYVFEAALSRTDAVIQPRQSNTWGALSLDHVFEFMGGMNLAVRNVTGKDPDAYLSDYRNRNNVRMQEVKEAIGVESRTTIFNPNFIREKMKGEAGAANEFAEIVRNTYGWNVMKPKAIDKQVWDEIYNVYVKDKFNLGITAFFEKQNPAALQEMTAVMMETARKGMWDASEQQLKDIAVLHTALVNKYKPACSGFVCDNAKLRDFMVSKSSEQAARVYKENIKEVREAMTENNSQGVVMKKEEMNSTNQPEQTNTLSNTIVAAGATAAILGIIIWIRKKRKQQE